MPLRAICCMAHTGDSRPAVVAVYNSQRKKKEKENPTTTGWFCRDLLRLSRSVLRLDITLR